MNKVIAFFMFVLLTITLGGCDQSSPPIYKSGVSSEKYLENLGDWFGGKFSSTNEAELEAYGDESRQLVKVFVDASKRVDTPQEAVALVDRLGDDLISLSSKYFNFTIEDWKFIVDPDVDKSASHVSKELIKQTIGRTMFGFEMAVGFFPSSLRQLASDAFKKTKKEKLYYQVATDSKYSYLINDNSWVESYNASNKILDVAKSIAVAEGLFIDVNQNSINELQADVSRRSLLERFEIIDSQEIMGSTYEWDAWKFNEELLKYSKEDFYKKNSLIAVAVRDVEDSLKYLEVQRETHMHNPEQAWTKQSVDSAQERLAGAQSRLLEAEARFEKLYDADMERFEEQFEILMLMHRELHNNLPKLQHNIAVFIKTYQNLVQAGFEQQQVQNVLYRNRLVDNLDAYNASSSIELEHSDRLAFEEYMTTMYQILE